MKRIANAIQVLMYNGQLQKLAICTLAMVLLLTNSLHAQVGDPSAGNAGDGDPDVPIDGGLSLLVAAGVGYGTKKIKEKRIKRLL